MQLYSYDHCPFCVRARLILGIHKISFELITLLNDDEETPIRLIGKKMLPILVKDDGQAMGESMDIVRYIDSTSQAPILSTAPRQEILDWCEAVNPISYHLVMPRVVEIGLEEFKTDKAKAYYIKKKTALIGDFSENIKNSVSYITQINDSLKALSDFIADVKAPNFKPTEEDFYLFPLLRSLSVVKGLIFPEPLLNYLDYFHKVSKVDLFFSRSF